MALAEMVDGYGLRALARAACVGHVYFCSHGAGITIGVFQLISAALAKHEPREISKSTRQGTKLLAAIEGEPTVHFIVRAPRDAGLEDPGPTPRCAHKTWASCTERID